MKQPTTTFTPPPPHDWMGEFATLAGAVEAVRIHRWRSRNGLVRFDGDRVVPQRAPKTLDISPKTQIPNAGIAPRGKTDP